MQNDICALLNVFLLFYGILQYNVQNVLSADPKCGKVIDADYAAKIVGGEDVGYYKYPWFVSLTIDDRAYCGGTLISVKHVVTAAHCFQPYEKDVINGRTTYEKIFTPILGVYNICKDEKTQREFQVAKVYIHEDYKEMDPYYDIALLRLNKRTTGFEPCCMPKKPLNSNTRPKTAIIAGLGDLKFNTNKETCTVQEAKISIYKDDSCKKMLNSQGDDGSLLEHAFCAGYLKGGIDACQGDSGGPLMILTSRGHFTLLGVTSFGYDCAKPGALGVYTDVSHFMTWIRKNMQGQKGSSRDFSSSIEDGTDARYSNTASNVTFSTSASVYSSGYPAAPEDIITVDVS